LSRGLVVRVSVEDAADNIVADDSGNEDKGTTEDDTECSCGEQRQKKCQNDEHSTSNCSSDLGEIYFVGIWIGITDTKLKNDMITPITDAIKEMLDFTSASQLGVLVISSLDEELCQGRNSAKYGGNEGIMDSSYHYDNTSDHHSKDSEDHCRRRFIRQQRPERECQPEQNSI